MKFVDVKNDMAFHKIFGTANKTEALMSFINAILKLPEENKITFLEILNPYQLPNVQDAKSIIIDIKARDNNKKEYIIEMQVADIVSFAKRVLYYTAKNFADQIERGDSYKKLNPIIFIGILDFNYSPSAKYLSKHIISEEETHEVFLKDIEYYFVELPKFNKKEDELADLADEWLYFIKNAEYLKKFPTDVEDKGLQIAYTDANLYSWTKEEAASYDYMFMVEQDIKGRAELVNMKAELLFKEAEIIRKEAELIVQEAQEKAQEAQEKAQEAQEKAKEAQEKAKEAQEKGMKENSIEIAKKMIKRGLSNEIISEDTGLEITEIEQIRLENR